MDRPVINWYRKQGIQNYEPYFSQKNGSNKIKYDRKVNENNIKLRIERDKHEQIKNKL